MESENEIRPSESSSSNSSAILHAHFNEEDEALEAHDSVIPVTPCGEGRLSVRLGFLKIQHVYQVKFPVVDDLGEDVTFDPLENLHAKIESAAPSEDGQGHDIVLVFSALKEKLLKASVTIKSAGDDSRMLKLDLCARVLGKHKGTPALKKGIHVLRIEGDDDSEVSDWQGF